MAKNTLLPNLAIEPKETTPFTLLAHFMCSVNKSLEI